uniref:SFRICE_027857 n=1 Tax=Spodoptera frugiperda TaxID=7108 RepID=A0A2H1VDG6_SPOFR
MQTKSKCKRPQARIVRIPYDVISTHRMLALPMMRSVRCGSVDAVGKTQHKRCFTPILCEAVVSLGLSWPICAETWLTRTYKLKYKWSFTEQCKRDGAMMYITFQDNPSGNVGFKGTTFHAILGQ